MTSIDSPSQSQWPKTFLLQCMEQAVKEGCIRLDFGKDYGSHAPRMAKSFIGAINRIRRRSDKQHASFIIPEYHLIGTTWEEERGTLLITYDSLPDNMKLPSIVSLSENEKREMKAPEPIQPATLPPPLASERPPGSLDGSFDAKKLVDDLLGQPFRPPAN